ncbi:MAG: TldD/PmbA family protein [Oscillospiraceae bacterium]|jgi:PmbA protein|nr:TldD/PmbA family protein [Oscillospiraceae bacterium]
MADVKQTLYDAAQYALDRAKALGADGAEVSVSTGNRTDELNVDAGEFSLMRTTFGSAVTVSVIAGQKYGGSATNKTDRGSIDKTVENAIEAAKASDADEAQQIAPDMGERESKQGSGATEPDLDAIYDRMSEFLADTKREYPKLDVMQFISRFRRSNKLYANSSGTRFFTERAWYSASAEFSARDGDEVSSMFGAGLNAADFNRPLLGYPFVRRAVEMMEPQLKTQPVQGKFTGTLLCSPDVAAELISSALSNAVGSASIIQKTSPWLGKVGEVVADPRLTLIADPDETRVLFPEKFTDDGFVNEREEVIGNGLLTGFKLGLYGSLKTGLPRAKNDGYFESLTLGTKTYGEMLAGIENGLLVYRFSGGSPAQNGDFSGVAKNSFLIKNGKIAGAVSETMISGNVFELLKNIVDIGSEPDLDGSSALPFISFGGVTVSGK